MAAEGGQVGVDTAKAQAFAGRLLTALNDAALCLMVSVGHRTGLFDVMTQSPPATSEDLASRAGLNERYVREWLGAMVTARVVTIHPATSRFTLPAEHAAFLTRAAVADNMAVFAQYIAVMGSVEDDIVECSGRAAGCLTRGFDGSTRSWRRIAANPCFHRSSRTSCRSCRD